MYLFNYIFMGISRYSVQDVTPAGEALYYWLLLTAPKTLFVLYTVYLYKSFTLLKDCAAFPNNLYFFPPLSHTQSGTLIEFFE